MRAMLTLLIAITLLQLSGCDQTTKTKSNSGEAPSFSSKHPSSFRTAKKLGMEITKDRRHTFYCECDFTDKKEIKSEKCGYKVRKQPHRGARVEFEHIVPAWAFGHQRQCWQQGGRENCERNDPVFKKMEADLHNLVPSVGELNADRSNFRYAELIGEPRAYGKCDFEVDFKGRKAEPMPSIRGDIARTQFYMAKRYGLTLSNQQQQLFEAWDKSDPVDDWEKERDKRIKRIQGNGNCFVSGKC